MPQHMRSRLIFHGATVFLMGMLAGFPYAFVLIADLDPNGSTWIPGTVRAWRMAHLEGALNGMVLILVAAAAGHLPIRPRGQQIILYGLIITAWGNILASINSALTGGRGLAFDGVTMNSLTYVLFMAAIFAILAAFTLIAEAAWRDSKTTSSDAPHD